jgi:hypothetical protein
MMPPPAIPLISAVDEPVTSHNGTVLPPYSTTYYFDQLIDHNNPLLGTFKQRYWHTYEYYEPGALKECSDCFIYVNYLSTGGPIILTTPGESNANGKLVPPYNFSRIFICETVTGYYTYLTNKSINGLIAQQQNGSTIVLEHRFYGLSNPFPDLTVKSLRYHTIQQAIDDLVYFAQNVTLPMPNGDKVTPDKAPWILIGGSYSGAYV